MGIKQISVFLENTTGRLSEVTKTLAKAGINLRAIIIADTADFGILRIIVDKTDEAINALVAAGFTTKLTDVLAAEIDDTPGSLAKIVELFEKAQVNIDYLYATLEGQVGRAVVVIRPEDYEKGQKLLNDNKIKLAEKFL
jgi:hypothetical protein